MNVIDLLGPAVALFIIAFVFVMECEERTRIITLFEGDVNANIPPPKKSLDLTIFRAVFLATYGKVATKEEFIVIVGKWVSLLKGKYQYNERWKALLMELSCNKEYYASELQNLKEEALPHFPFPTSLEEFVCPLVHEFTIKVGGVSRSRLGQIAQQARTSLGEVESWFDRNTKFFTR